MRLMQLNFNDIDHTFIQKTKQAWAATFSAASETCLRFSSRAVNDRTAPTPPALGRCGNLNAYIALLTPVLTLAGCFGSTLLSSQRPITVESLEGDYLRLASCTYERLNRKDGRLRMADSSDRDRVKIDFDPGSSRHWYLSFINEEPGRLTRLEMTLPPIAEGSFPREHALATARACAA
jgi:hypothetical protein